MDSTQTTQEISAGFVPSAPSHAIIRLCQSLLEFYEHSAPYRISVVFDPSVINWMKLLHGQRAIICPNHCAHEDPIVAFALAKEAHEEFCFLTAREIFMWHPSLRSKWLQHLGCYSVLRASADVEAFKHTVAILKEGKHKVVIFPEGEVTHQNRFLSSLESGPERMAIAAADLLSASGNPSPVYVLPVGIAYRYKEDILPQLSAILARQERKLGLHSHPEYAIEHRLVRAFDKMLDEVARQYGYKNEAATTTGEKITCFLTHTLSEIAAACATNIPDNLSMRERLHALKKVFINHRYARRKEAVADWERMLYRRIKHATNLVALSDDSFRNLSSQERLAELVNILEYEVSGRVSLNAERIAYVACSKPIDVSTCSNGNRVLERRCAKAVSQQLKAGINDALDYLESAFPERPLIGKGVCK